MSTQLKIYMVLLFIWLVICSVIAYQAQFISDYLVHVRGMTQAEYKYPLQHVLILSAYLAVLLLNSLFYFSTRFRHQHPILIYFICSILPLLFSVGAVFSAMHAPHYYMIFLFSILVTTLMQLVFAPFIAYTLFKPQT